MSGPIRIAHLSDLHLGAHHPDASATLAADVTAAGPTLTVVTGDLTMRAREAEFTQARAVLDRLPRPLLVVPGNHDVRPGLPGRLRSPFARYLAGTGAGLDLAVRLPGLAALGLASPSPWRWQSGVVSPRQARLVGDAFDGTDPAVLRLLALHHPVSPRGTARIAGRGRLLRAAAAAGADLVLVGHTHRPAVRLLLCGNGDRPWPVTEVTAGTATSSRLRGPGRSWNLILHEAGCLVVQERRQDGPRWVDGPATRHPRPVRSG
jgi:3',5'-cyclic AMP phosphodiesterase CpdA